MTDTTATRYRRALCEKCRPARVEEECSKAHGARPCEACGEEFVGACVYVAEPPPKDKA